MVPKKKKTKEEAVTVEEVPVATALVTQEMVLAKLSEEEESGEPVVGGWMERVERIVKSLEG